MNVAAPNKRLASVAVALLSAGFMVSVTDPATSNERSRSRDEPKPGAASLDFAGPARLAVVSLARQHVTFYDAAGGSVRAPISSGQAGMDTPVGVYSILQKKVDHTSNIYDDAKMPFMQRITWSGVALHAGALPGYPASHGCVRLPLSFAGQIFEKTNLGLRVVISRDDVAPVSIKHDALFQPRPLSESDVPAGDVAPYDDASDPPLMPDVSGWSLRHREQGRLRALLAEKVAAARAAGDAAEPHKAPYEQKLAERKKLEKSLKSAESEKKAAEKRLASAEKWLAAAKKPKAIESAEKSKAKAQAALEKAEAKLQPLADQASRIDAELAEVKARFDEAEAARTAAAAAATEVRRKLLPVSVFVSLDTQKLYVRQGHSPVMEMPVEIRDPDMPIGTHVFTALDFSSDGNTARWSVVSLARYEDTYGGYGDYDEFEDFNRRRRKETHRKAAPTDIRSAAAALERIVIPSDLEEKLSEYVWPGSSIIISDEPMHKKETNDHTDFVVLLSGYPQGGIKKRPPPPPAYYYDDGPFAFFAPSNPRSNSYYYGGYGNRPYGTRQRYKKQPSIFSWW